MKLARFQTTNGAAVGRVEGDRVIAIDGVGSVIDLIAPDRLAEIAAAGHADGLALSEVTLLPSVIPPRNVFCVGWNYRPHFDEGSRSIPGAAERELPDLPTFFSKPVSSLVGPYDPIEADRSVTDALDWEAELAVIIGVGGSNIGVGTALDHVFGYAVANDVTARDLQRVYGGQWFKSKGLDRTCPFGPWITTADEVGDPNQLDVTCEVNGVNKQSASTATMIFTVAEVIAELSKGMALLPGDVILTGTPAGIGSALTPPEALAVGDVVEAAVSGLGRLRNEVVEGGRT